MNSPTIVVLLASVLIFSFQATGQEPSGSVGKLYLSGQTMYKDGDLVNAKAHFEQVLILQPTHKGAQNYLRMITEKERTSGSGTLQKQMDSLIIPEVNFSQASLESVLQFLPQLAEKSSGGSLKAPFVVRLAPEQLQQKVTLKLQNMPYSEVVRYVGELTGVTFRAERFAIVALPAQAQAAPVPVVEDTTGAL